MDDLILIMPEASDLPNDLIERSGKLLSHCPLAEWNPDVIEVLNRNLSKSKHLGIACSGGADSLFTLLLFYAAFPLLRHKIIVLHFNHKLRGKDSETDESYVASICLKLNLRLISKSAKNSERKDEASLRDLRIGFFNEVSHKNGMDIILQGHHLNDVAESLLWRVARGSYTEGLSSPKPVSKVGSICFIRPFIDLPKKRILAAMKVAEIPWREDLSNESALYLRNRLRQSVMPVWQNAVDHDLLKGLAKTAQAIRDDAVALDFHAKKAFDGCMLNDGSIDLHRMNHYPNATQLRIIRLWLSAHSRVNPRLKAEKAQMILKELESSQWHRLQVDQNAWVMRSGNCLHLEKDENINPIPLSSLPINSEIHFPDRSFSIAAEISNTSLASKEIKEKSIDPSQMALICHNAANNGVFLRTRKEGDSFRPMGSKGTKKLTRRMIDQKWTNPQKIKTPVFLNSEGQILWVPGFPPSDFAKVRNPKHGVIRLTYKATRTE